MGFRPNFMSLHFSTASFAYKSETTQLNDQFAWCGKKLHLKAIFPRLLIEINIINLGRADDACPSMKFWQWVADCYNTSTISNYLAIIIIAKNKDKLMTKGYVPSSKPSDVQQDSKEQFKTTGTSFQPKLNPFKS